MLERRVPTQARSRKRYDAILRAAAELFADVGFEGTTTDAIAQKAGTSIGSIYQFFADKKSIYLAMADRLMAREEEVLAQALADNAGKSWREVLDAVIDAYVELQEREPAWRAMWATNLAFYGEVVEMSETYMRRIVEMTTTIVKHYAPQLTGERLEVVALTLVEAIGAMLMVSYRYPKKRRRAMLQESKRMLQLYAADVLAS